MAATETGIRSKEQRRPVAIFGHRGARGIFPENTMPGFQYALEIGISGIEIDVLLNKDLVPFVTHYPVLLAETTRGSKGQWVETDSGLISRMSLAELQNYDVGATRPGSKLQARFPDQARLNQIRVPKLEEVASLFAKYPQATLNIEIKSYATQPNLTAPPEVMAEKILEVINRCKIGSRTILSSFDWRVLHACRDQDPAVRRYYLSYLDRPNPPMEPNIFDGSPWMDGTSLAANGGSLPQLVADLGGTGWCPHFEDLNAEDLTRAHALGLLVNVWTVNDWHDISRMAELEADAIISDYPARVQNVLAGHGHHLF